MRVLLTIHNLPSTGGGTSAVVQNLSRELALTEAEISILTHELSPGESEALPQNGNVRVNHVSNTRHGALGGGFRGKLIHLLTKEKYDLVHDFGLWLPSNHIAATVSRKLGVPYVNSPSGMLASWSTQHKRLKKSIAWWLYQRRDLLSATLLTATAPEEASDIRKRLPQSRIALIPNGVEIPISTGNARPYPVARGHIRTVGFIGRIHPVKGLKNLVEAWHLVRPKNWRCIIAGPDEGGHQKELEHCLERYGLRSTFEFPGLLNSSQKWDLLRSVDLFVLPSFTENFGIAAAEALGASVPVIATKGSPWKDLVNNKCGWWIDIGPEPLARALSEATSLSDTVRKEMGDRGRVLVRQRYDWSKIAVQFIEVYSWVAFKTAQPSFITTPANEF